MKNLIKISLAAILFGSINACAPVYRPTSINTPMFDSADEAQVGLYTGNSGYDLQTAYSVDDNIGVMVNATYQNREEDSSFSRKHNYVEAGVGYYKNFGNTGAFEFFGGYGFGYSEAIDIAQINSNSDSFSASGNYTRLFFQPTLAYKDDDVEVGLATRFSFINFTNYQDNFRADDPTKLSTLFIEPTAFINLNLGDFRLTYQLGLVLPQSEIDFSHSLMMNSIGIRYMIPGFGRKR